MSEIMLGVGIAILHVILFFFLEKRKYVLLLFAIIEMIPMVMCCGRIAILLVVLSIGTELLVHFLKQIKNGNFDRIGDILNKQKSLSLYLCALILLFAFSVYGLCTRGSFESDVMGAYIGNLYSTKRFSATPFFDTCPMHLILFGWVIYYCGIKNKVMYDELYISVLGTVLVYIFVIGYCYIHFWAIENLKQNGEYLTNFAHYMIPAVALWYSIAIFSIMTLAIRKVIVGIK